MNGHSPDASLSWKRFGPSARSRLRGALFGVVLSHTGEGKMAALDQYDGSKKRTRKKKKIRDSSAAQPSPQDDTEGAAFASG